MKKILLGVLAVATFAMFGARVTISGDEMGCRKYLGEANRALHQLRTLNKTGVYALQDRKFDDGTILSANAVGGKEYVHIHKPPPDKAAKRPQIIIDWFLYLLSDTFPAATIHPVALKSFRVKTDFAAPTSQNRGGCVDLKHQFTLITTFGFGDAVYKYRPTRNGLHLIQTINTTPYTENSGLFGGTAYNGRAWFVYQDGAGDQGLLRLNSIQGVVETGVKFPVNYTTDSTRLQNTIQTDGRHVFMTLYRYNPSTLDTTYGIGVFDVESLGLTAFIPLPDICGTTALDVKRRTLYAGIEASTSLYQLNIDSLALTGALTALKTFDREQSAMNSRYIFFSALSAQGVMRLNRATGAITFHAFPHICLSLNADEKYVYYGSFDAGPKDSLYRLSINDMTLRDSIQFSSYNGITVGLMNYLESSGELQE